METLLQDEQVEQLLDDFLECYGYDFTGYSRASLRRRLQRLYLMGSFLSFDEFRYRLKNDPGYFNHSVEEISVNVTEMFRDPAFYRVIREKVVPNLASFPLIRIWHAGCSSGEEMYSLAIILEEAGLLNKSLLYGTDINPLVLEKARKGIYSIGYMQQYSKNYQASGGQGEFSSYYTAHYNMAQFDERLSRRMVFATHNLVSDFSFNSFQLIFCRNVLIYFDKNLQSHVLSLFDKSLDPQGFLALGSKESLRFSSLALQYRAVEGREKIWRKMQ